MRRYEARAVCAFTRLKLAPTSSALADSCLTVTVCSECAFTGCIVDFYCMDTSERSTLTGYIYTTTAVLVVRPCYATVEGHGVEIPIWLSTSIVL